MNKLKRKPIAIGLLAIACYMPVLSNANMQAALDGMFTTITNPSAYQSQNRMGAVGGSLTLRVPNQRVSIFTLDVPRMDMGCGGIDMFGGSFSFINADALVAIMRNIGQIAVAALFKIAIASISNTLSMNISEFLNILQGLSNMKMNSCKIGAAIGGGLADTLLGPDSKAFQTADNQKTVYEAATGRKTGGWGQFWEGFKKTVPEKSRAPKVTDASNGGNVVWRALWFSKAYQAVTMGDGSDGKVATLIMNITGTEIKANEDDCNKHPDWPICINPTGAELVGGKQVSIENLIDPGDWKIKTFTDTSGDNFNEYSFTQTIEGESELSAIIGKGGFRGLAMRILFGTVADDLETNPSAMQSSFIEANGGVLNYIKTGDWGTFKASEWLERIPSPVLRQLVVMQRDEKVMSGVAYKYSGLIAEEMAIALAESLADAAKKAYSGKSSTVVGLPSYYEANLKHFLDSIAKYKLSKSEELAREERLNAFIQATSATLGSASGMWTMRPSAKR